jgi:hypothetical protein
MRSTATRVAPASDAPARGVTRRRLLATGGVAGAAAIVGFRPWAPDQAAAASDVPNYLLRSSYLSLSSPSFSAAGLPLKLEGVSDLPPAVRGGSLAGSEDAFALAFSSPQDVAQGLYTFSHADLGEFDFFIAPVEQKSGTYEVVVNRSVNAPRHAPKQRPPRDTGSSSTADQPANGTAGSGDSSAPGTQSAAKRGPHVRRISARRLAHAVVAEVVLEPDVKVKRASVWLLRGERVVSAATVRQLHGSRFAIRLPMSHRPRGGRYNLIVATTDRHGRDEFKRAKVTLH